jgi:UDP-N-acetylmuramoyl-L-alanyl-D-glutamate--2,6-diaminopimelate ligase
MRVDEMLADVKVTRTTMPAGMDLRGVTSVSGAVGAGDLFVAVRGGRFDGLAFLPEALAAGARALVVGSGRFEEAEAALGTLAATASGPVALIEVADEREALALLGRNAMGRPDLELKVTGITGTNGKTTTAWLLSAMYEAAGTRCGLMGTVEHRIGSDREEASRTTPEGPEIHRWLRRMRDSGAGACVMEVSSHSLDLRRVAGMRFSTAIFTNLTQDHLDYHGSMESYYAAKRRLFEGLDGEATAVINADDGWGRRLAGGIAGRRLLFGREAGADIRMVECRTGVGGTEIELEERGDTAGAASKERVVIRSPLVGLPNGYNLLAAAAAARAAGLSWDAIRIGAAGVRVVPGRLERVDAGQGFAVLVDYAHTDDALRNVLEALRPLTAGRLITVFGCGGDRDTGKRPLMGAHAARLSDLFWVTSDNPRSEDPGSIIGMVLDGVRGESCSAERCRVEPDRKEAIHCAIAEARDGDTVLIAGKGHERIQISANGTVPFDDVEVAREALAMRRQAHGEGGDGEPA